MKEAAAESCDMRSYTRPVRIRSREHNGRSTYSITKRDLVSGKDFVEEEHKLHSANICYQAMTDTSRLPLHKQRRCFMVGCQYLNLDIYTGEPLPLPDFLTIEKEVTGQPAYSMYSMSKKPDAVCEVEEFLGAAEFKDD
ncbi:unnamed protein product [Cylicocyclus nassatus]|uniref:Uncharacterized protein n=1 Tax=Cylicocyclus nassatus TaxID=53992 RepID=A0AA36H011_CYLNA|nr:unnamed protein product [Cylicocyclus nassatus]